LGRKLKGRGYWPVLVCGVSEIVRVRREKQAQMPGMERPEQLDLPGI